jgi:CelD/BcsL family acetyltransferase involved in cellulose biosynthesis
VSRPAGPGTLATPLEVRERGPARDLAALAPEWDALWERCRHATPFQRPEWLLPWLDTFPPREPVVLEMRRDGRLVALAPLFCYQAGPERVLVPAGAGISDYLELLVDAREEAAALDALGRWLATTPRRWDRLDLLDLHPTSPLLGPWVPGGWTAVIEPHDACPVLVLDGGTDRPAAIPAGQLARLRRARRHTARAGVARVEVADRGTLDRALDELFRLHHEAWAARGGAGVLADPRVQAFHRRAAPGLLGRGVLRLYLLRLDGDVIAALYALFERHGAYCYLQGFDPAHHRLSPAMQLLGAVIEDAAARGLPWIDFLRGREPYKYGWGARDAPTMRMRVFRPAAAA